MSSIATTFGAKTVVKGKDTYVEFADSGEDVLNNIKKSMGIAAKKTDGFIEGDIEIKEKIKVTENSTMFETSDIKYAKNEMDMKSTNVMKVTSDDTFKYTKSKTAVHSEYEKLVLSDGIGAERYMTTYNHSEISVDIELANSAKKIKGDFATRNFNAWFGERDGKIVQKQVYDFVKTTNDVTDKIDLGINLICEDGNDIGIVAYSKFTDTKFGKFITDYVVDYSFEEGEYNTDHFDFGSKWTGLVDDSKMMLGFS